VFASHESVDLSYGLVFIPCPVWVRGNKEIINLNPERPDYQLGSVRKLMDREPIERNLVERSCTVIVHSVGHGSQKDFDNLITDLKVESFKATVYNRFKE
jgi:hypothetical protein